MAAPAADPSAVPTLTRRQIRERAARRQAIRGAVIAAISTVIVVGALIAAIGSSSGWPQVQQAFFSWADASDSFGKLISAFVTNIEIFLIAEPLILVLGLLIALARGLRGPVFFPVRALAIIYTDLIRGIPTLLLIYLLGFGVPSLGLAGVPSSPFFWATAALVISYSAYVAEVFRAGIESVHPSQVAAARSLGLRHGQAMVHVVVPQAVRRVIPPLMNDFISLQKDTALAGTVGVLEILKQGNIIKSLTFNFTPIVVAALCFIALTIPMTRLADYLVRRSQGRRSAGTSYA